MSSFVGQVVWIYCVATGWHWNWKDTESVYSTRAVLDMGQKFYLARYSKAPARQTGASVAGYRVPPYGLYSIYL